MKLARKLVSGAVVLASFGLSGAALAASCPSVLTLPTASGANSVTFGDGISYSLPILGLDVQSSPGQISDCIVIATGSSGNPVTTNFAGMDNAYATPNGTGGAPYFRTGDPVSSPDPGGLAPEFLGDTATTWDTTIAALEAFLNGSDPVVYFNHNQTNAGTAIDQNLAVWAQIRIWNAVTQVSEYFYITSIPNNTGLQNFGQPGGNPLAYTGPQTPPTSTYPTGPDSLATFPYGGVGTGLGSGDARFMVDAIGQVCLNGPVGSGTPVPCSGPHVATVNDNLGADHVANAVVFPELNAILDSANNGGFTNISVDLRMGCNPAMSTTGCAPGFVLNNGFEQVFIGRLSPTAGPPSGGAPEPATIALVGVALLGLAIRRRRIH